MKKAQTSDETYGYESREDEERDAEMKVKKNTEESHTCKFEGQRLLDLDVKPLH